MTPCDDCPIDDKIYECCGRYPETGETACLRVSDNRMVHACPHLKADGRCDIYEHRPLACQTHYCHGYDTRSDNSSGYTYLTAHWEKWWQGDGEV